MSEIPGGGAAAVLLRAGDRIRLVNTFGTQVVDSWCLSVADMTEYLSVEHTRRMLGRLFPAEGDSLFSNRRNALLKLERDTSGCRHDMLCACCDPWLYRFHNRPDGHPNCHDNFLSSLRAIGVECLRVPNPINFWMNVAINENSRIELREPESNPGDYLILRALVNVHIVFSACPMDITPVNGGGFPRSVEYEVLERALPSEGHR